MDRNQAKEILDHLILELNSNGFGIVVTEVNTRLEEDLEFEKWNPNYLSLLRYFLKESIEIFENLSNNDFPGLINRLNKYLDGGHQIQTVSVEMITGEDEFYDLKNLPDYENIINALKEIQVDIQKEN